MQSLPLPTWPNLGATCSGVCGRDAAQVVRVASKTGGVVAYTTAQSPGLAAPQQRTLAGRGSGGAGLAQQEQLAAPSATEPPRPLEPSSPAPPPAAFEGFDGLGNDEAAYSLAQVRGCGSALGPRIRVGLPRHEWAAEC